jgi:hypothetical protein
MQLQPYITSKGWCTPKQENYRNSFTYLFLQKDKTPMGPMLSRDVDNEMSDYFVKKDTTISQTYAM